MPFLPFALVEGGGGLLLGDLGLFGDRGDDLGLGLDFFLGSHGVVFPFDVARPMAPTRALGRADWRNVYYIPGAFASEKWRNSRPRAVCRGFRLDLRDGIV